MSINRKRGAAVASVINRRGQVTIPKAVREHLGLSARQRVKFFFDREGHAVMLPVLPVSSLKGLLRVETGVSATIEDMDEVISAAVADRFVVATRS
jgi:AbrB family looped-hinge helix DNA binding protein